MGLSWTWWIVGSFVGAFFGAFAFLVWAIRHDEGEPLEDHERRLMGTDMR